MAKQKAIYIKVSEEQHQKYKEFAVKNKTDISTLVRNLLDKAVQEGDINGLGRTTKENS